jgi:hypothetical protein
LKPARHYCEHLSARELTRWKYRIVANFYLVAWLLHPTRLFRIAYNAMKGKQTTALEKFLGDRGRKLMSRVKRRSRGKAVAGPQPRSPEPLTPL